MEPLDSVVEASVAECELELHGDTLEDRSLLIGEGRLARACHLKNTEGSLAARARQTALRTPSSARSP